MTDTAFRLHPLVLLSISDHHTRFMAQLPSEAEAPRVLGCLLGTHAARTVEISNSFEITYAGVVDGVPQVDFGFLTQKQEQYKKVFPKLDVVGWYSTGSALQEADLELHRALSAVTESPVYALFNPNVSTARELPVTLYESEVRVVNEAPSLTFVPASYTVETGEAERIAVDHVTRVVENGANSSSAQLGAHLLGMQSAATMLAARVKVLHEYVAGVEAGRLPLNHALLRQIAAFLSQLPAADTCDFEREFMTEINDTLLLMQLSTMTSGVAALGDYTDRLSVVHGERGHSRRGGLLG